MSPHSNTDIPDGPIAFAVELLPPTLAALAVLSVVSYVSQVILHPIYGSLGTGLHHWDGVFIVSAATSLLTMLGSDKLPPREWDFAGMVTMVAPITMPVLFRFSRQWGPTWGPVLTQGLLTWPCVLLFSHYAARRVKHVIGNELRRSASLAVFLAVSITIAFTMAIKTSERIIIRFVAQYVGVLWSRFSILVYTGAVCSRRWIFLPVMILVLQLPHVQTGVTSGLLSKLPAEYTYLARRESITGMITVVENADVGYRVLKCDHSLLGGLWTGIKRKELAGSNDLEWRTVNEAESVYTAFLVQEAIRLVERSGGNKVLIMYLLNC
jgi:hypothetical protein